MVMQNCPSATSLHPVPFWPEGAIQPPQRCPDDLQGGTDSRSFSRMVGLLDRWASSFGVGVNFSKAAKARQKKKILSCSLVLLMCFARPY